MAPQINHPTPDPVPEQEKRVGDIEKDHANNEADEKGSDSDSSYKQEGVRQVEAITTVWTKQVLIVMFVLYVLTLYSTSSPDLLS